MGMVKAIPYLLMATAMRPIQDRLMDITRGLTIMVDPMADMAMGMEETITTIRP